MRQGWEAEAQNWVQFARTPGRDHAHDEINMPALLDLLPGPGRATLDVACGEGRLSRYLQSLGHRVVGIDASPTMVRFANGHASAAPVLLGDATGLPFSNEAFDLAVAYMCLHDIDDLVRAVAEIARVLAWSGRLCAAIPHPVSTAGSFQGRDADAAFVISGSYLQAVPVRMVAENDGVRLTFHSEHRPLESYARALETSGLLIESIREVKPPDHLAGGDPGARRWQRIPLFLHLRAIKP
jgi:SAM-dependent methyltransferase